MTLQRSRIVRAFARGESIAQIAESSGVSYGQAWSHLRRAVAELDRKNPSARDTIRFQQWLLLTRIADHAFAAFEKSAEKGVSEVSGQTIESRDDSGHLGLAGKSVTHRVRKDAGDVRYLEVAMKALREIRDLFRIGAEAESKLGVAAPEASVALEALMRTGAVQRRAGPSQSKAARTRGCSRLKPKRTRVRVKLTSLPASKAEFKKLQTFHRIGIFQRAEQLLSVSDSLVNADSS